MQSRPNRPPLAAGTGLVSSHRIRAQILSPSMSTCTEAGGPISRPPGSFAHSPPGMLGPPPSANPLTGRYGLSAGAWAKHETFVASSTAMPHNVIHPTRFAFDMAHLIFSMPRLHRAPAQQRAGVRGGDEIEERFRQFLLLRYGEDAGSEPDGVLQFL